MTKKRLFVAYAAICLLLGLITSCGGGGGGGTQAVQGTTIRLNPSGWGQATTLGTSGSNSQYVRVSAQSPTGYPQIGVKLIIDSQYVVYDGHPPSLVGLTPVTTPFEVTTSANGTYDVTVLYDWPTAIAGDFTGIQVWSGTGYGTADITFTCYDPDTSTAPDCP